ncbi:MAG: hypothetical protein HN837_10185, partial [Chloroflexi bacterium]|nr:hypothetical protein [Chloroflexota bacterium]
ANHVFLIMNDASSSYSATVKTYSGAATVATLAAGKSSLFSADDGTWAQVGGGGNGYGTTEARLTLATGMPITTTDQTAKTTVYLTPYKGNVVMLYTGSAWVVHNLTELSIAVPSTTNTPFDIFLDYNAGTPQLAVTDWTNDTTRATALTTQDGVYVQTGNTDWKYLGTGCTTGVSGQIENSETKRLLWNYYNRVSTNISVIETTASWSYSTAAYRPLNNDTTNRIEIVCGVSEDAVDIDVMAVVLSDAVNPRYTGIGVNATNANTWDILIRSAGIAYSLAHTKLRTVPAVGYTYYQCLEYGSGAGTQTWYGASEAGISAMWMC